MTKKGVPSQTYTTEVAVLPEIQEVVTQRATNNSMKVTFDLGEPVQGLFYEVDYGDGHKSNQSKSEHTYQKLGTYDYTVTIRDHRSTSARSQYQDVSAQNNLSMQSGEAPVLYRSKSFHTIWRKAPVANLKVTTPEGDIPFGVAPFTATFSAEASKDLNTEAANLSYEWDFGDGSAKKTGVTVQHQYDKDSKKPHLVTLKVTNQWGLSDSKQIHVHSRSPSSYAQYSINYPNIQATAALNSDPLEGIIDQALLENHKEYDENPLTLAPNSEQMDANDTFPYVIADNHVIARVYHKMKSVKGEDSHGFCNSYFPYKDGVKLTPRYVYWGEGTQFCKAMVFLPKAAGKFPALPHRTFLISSSRGLHNTTFHVFHRFSVPRLSVSIVPDDFIAGDKAGPQIKEYVAKNSEGVQENVVRVLVRASETSHAFVKVKVPIKAVDKDNKFMSSVNGILYPEFSNVPTENEPVTMSNGKAYVTLNIPINNYIKGQKEIDLSSMTLKGPKGCGYDDTLLAKASHDRLAGCVQIVNTYQYPTENTDPVVSTLPAALQNSVKLGNHIFYGDSAQAAKAFKAYTQMGHAVAHTYVEWAAPYALWEEKQNDLQEFVDGLVADGKLTKLEAVQISLANLGTWASALPAGTVPRYNIIAAQSKISAGQTAAALEEALDPSAIKSMKQSEIAEVLMKALDECGLKCVNELERGLTRLTGSGKTLEESINSFESLTKTFMQKWDAGAHTGFVAAKNVFRLCTLKPRLTFSSSGDDANKACTEKAEAFIKEIKKILIADGDGGEKLSRKLEAPTNKLIELRKYKSALAEQLMDIVNGNKDKYLREIKGYSLLIKQLTNSQGKHQGFAVIQTLLKAKKLREEKK